MDYPEMDYLLKESLSDVVFVVDGHRLPALKSILSLKSRVFRVMFSDNYYQNTEPEESKLPEIVVKDTTVDAFKTLIRFIYTEVMVLKDQKNWLYIWDVYQLSDRYEVLRLRQKVFTHLESSINASNLLSITRVAFNHNIKELIPKVNDCIERNFKELVQNMDQLKELNDSTDDKLLDVITQQALDRGGSGNIRLWLTPNPPELIDVPTKGLTFEAIKEYIRFRYFNEMSHKNYTDLQLIRELCDMCIRNDMKTRLTSIGNYLKDRITVVNLVSMSGIAFDYKIVGLIETVNEINTHFFIKPLD